MRRALWIVGLAVCLAACAVNPMTPLPAPDGTPPVSTLDGASPAAPLATQAAGSPGQPSATPVLAPGAILTTAPSPAAPTSSRLPPTPTKLAAAVASAAVVAVLTPTPGLIVVANVALVTATATQVLSISAARSSAAQPTAAAKTAVPPVGVAAPASGDVAAAEQYTVGLINAQRAALSLSPLAADPTLMSIANGRVADMVARGYTGHNDPVTGEALGPALMRAAGFAGLVGENWYGSRLGPPAIADVAMKWFMTDPPHYHNILGTRYSGVGVGIAFNGQQWLLVQDFAGH